MHGAGGRMGKAIVRAIAEDPSLALVAAIDRAPELAGRDAGELAQVGRCGVAITSPPRSATIPISFSGRAPT